MKPGLFLIACAATALTLDASTITLTGTIRDFSCRVCLAPAGISNHPDFEWGISGLTRGLVSPTLSADKKPEFVGAPGAGGITSAASFSQWFTDTPGVNVSQQHSITLNEMAPGSDFYEYVNPNFFPIDGMLLGNQYLFHNYHFTYAINTKFTYKPGQVFGFTGDDDVYLYIDSKLALDLGGVHTAETGIVNLDTLGLTSGQTYDFDFYFAERHVFDSKFGLVTSVLFDPAVPTQSSAVPEPATLGMAATGIAAVLVSRLRLRR